MCPAANPRESSGQFGIRIRARAATLTEIVGSRSAGFCSDLKCHVLRVTSFLHNFDFQARYLKLAAVTWLNDMLSDFGCKSGRSGSLDVPSSIPVSNCFVFPLLSVLLSQSLISSWLLPGSTLVREEFYTISALLS